ncbi:hypothetical protein LEP1GSC193_0859 [Leptospira alstonii serovar Pingchang str. 80-412]|uniref:Uncharacterized protein n=2 Tax=Leptospira alstonii TaxID=28452 RepID=M6D2F9_9LEPT|nr:hypothetical protein LEP1GSC194_3639 [Leptospira alstonii serovar Sichuan str. 79601]EQA80110.1 hypothetical protein LEP1GSC193_0859 [Leptospira alstonii serovar Pingchang str. 80-412]
MAKSREAKALALSAAKNYRPIGSVVAKSREAKVLALSAAKN